MRISYVPVTEKQWVSQLGGFRGLPYQRGAGLGSVFRNIFRVLLPVAKSAGKAIGRQALKTGADIASDVLSGNELKSSVKKRGRQATASMLEKASKKLKGGRKNIKAKARRRKVKRKQVKTHLGVLRI